MMGTKMWHLADPKANRFKSKLHDHLKEIDLAAPLLFTIGEIDCRPEEGIWKIHKKSGRAATVLVKNTVNGYLKYLNDALVGRKISPLQVCPRRDIPWKENVIPVTGRVSYQWFVK